MTNSPLLGTETDPGIAPTSEERTMALLSHVLCVVIWLFPPLIIYLIKKDESAYVAAHAKESLNFQITVAICYFCCIILSFILIGLFLFWIVWLAAVIFEIMATVKANEGKLYKYPISIRLIK